MRALVALLLLAACPTTIKCDYHGVTATYVRDEYPSGKHYKVYAHGFGASRHELRVKC